MPKHFILTSAGTDGDVYPFVGLGTRLQSRGHRVTLVVNENYEDLAASHGFDFRALFSNAEFDEFVGNPHIWHPWKSALLGARWGWRHVARQYELLAELAADPETVLVSYPPILSARLVQEKLSRPLVTLMGMPWMIPSALEPPVMPSPLNLLPRRAPRPVGRAYWRAVDAVGDFLVSRHVNRELATRDLKPIRRIFQWWLSPDLVIGMFPDWYAPPQDDWPAQMKLAGFPLFDGRSDDKLPAAVSEFLNSGDPPVVLTFGTGMMHGADLFRAALEAVRIAGFRAILVTKYPEQLPDRLPASVLHCPFAPFGLLLGSCAAVVHHGGVGTTSQALRAGIPQLVLPLAWDQYDNATRVARLGAGDWLKPRRRSGAQIAAALLRVMTPETSSRCREIAENFPHHNALETAALWVEQHAAAVA